MTMGAGGPASKTPKRELESNRCLKPFHVLHLLNSGSFFKSRRAECLSILLRSNSSISSFSVRPILFSAKQTKKLLNDSRFLQPPLMERYHTNSSYFTHSLFYLPIPQSATKLRTSFPTSTCLRKWVCRPAPAQSLTRLKRQTQTVLKTHTSTFFPLQEATTLPANPEPECVMRSRRVAGK